MPSVRRDRGGGRRGDRGQYPRTRGHGAGRVREPALVPDGGRRCAPRVPRRRGMTAAGSAPRVRWGSRISARAGRTGGMSEVPDPPARRPRWILPVVVVAAVLVGAITATTVILISGWLGEPRYRFNVLVFLTVDATADQKTAVQSALPALHPVDGVRFEDRDQAWKKFQADFKDRP